MLKLAADENFNRKIVRGLRRRQLDLDIVIVQERDLTGISDPELLAWAASENRVLLTHDAATMAKFAYDRVNRGQPMPGVVEISQDLAIGPAIEDILLMANCSLEGEWQDQVIFIPFR